jgi:hypothetical protein
MAASWINGSRAMVTVNSIFAGFSGALLAAVLGVNNEASIRYWGAILAMVALVFFALAAEKITDALDEGKPMTYVWSMQLHNAGAISVLTALSMFLYLKLVPKPYFLVPLEPAFYWFHHLVLLSSRKYREEHAELISMVEPTGTTRK